MLALGVSAACAIALVAIVPTLSRWSSGDDAHAMLERVDERVRSEPPGKALAPRVDAEQRELPVDVPSVSGVVMYRMETEHSGPLVRPALGARVDFECAGRIVASAVTND